MLQSPFFGNRLTARTKCYLPWWSLHILLTDFWGLSSCHTVIGLLCIYICLVKGRMRFFQAISTIQYSLKRYICKNLFTFFSTWWPKPRQCILEVPRPQPQEDTMVAWEDHVPGEAWVRCLAGEGLVAPTLVEMSSLTNVNNVWRHFRPTINWSSTCMFFAIDTLIAIIPFCFLNDKYLLTFQTGAHWRKALQMLILRS